MLQLDYAIILSYTNCRRRSIHMAGVALRANCNENDINELNRIINGNYNDAIKKRARVILLNSQGILNKDIAAQVNMTPRLIGDWVRRFNEKGIPGLFDQPKPGRKGRTDSNLNLGDMIKAKLQEPAPDGYENWNAQCISEALGVPVTTVWAECRALGIRFQRIRNWQFDTHDEMTAKNLDVVALFCTSRSKAVVVRIGNREGGSLKGTFITHNKDTADEIGRVISRNKTSGVGSLVSLAEVLTVASEHASDNRRHAEVPLSGFLNRLADILPSEAGSSYMVLTYSDSAEALTRLNRPGFSFNIASSVQDWMQRSEVFLNTMCSSSQEQELLASSLRRYIDSVESSTEPFLWWKEPGAARETEETKSPVMLCSALSSDAEKTAPASGSGTGHLPKVEITISYTDETGSGKSQTISVTDGLIPSKDCDLSSADSIAAFMDNLTSRTIPVLDYAAQQIGTFAMESVKKNMFN